MQGHDRTREGLRLQHERASAHGDGDCHDGADGRLRGCSCAMAAGSKCLSAAIAIAVTCTAPTAALGKRADARNATPVGVTRRAAAAASTMRREHAATGCAKIT